MLEKDVEKRLRDKIKSVYGLCYKWLSPGNSGVPDRIVIMPGGRIIFVELKRPGGVLSELQKRQIARLRERGCRVEVLASFVEVDQFVEGLKDEV